jgi:hypothetical protein
MWQSLWQELLVGLIVLLAALYALRQWLPATWRERLGLKAAAGCGACKACGGARCSSTPQTESGAAPLRWEPPAR